MKNYEKILLKGKILIALQNGNTLGLTTEELSTILKVHVSDITIAINSLIIDVGKINEIVGNGEVPKRYTLAAGGRNAIDGQFYINAAETSEMLYKSWQAQVISAKSISESSLIQKNTNIASLIIAGLTVIILFFQSYVFYKQENISLESNKIQIEILELSKKQESQTLQAHIVIDSVPANLFYKIDTVYLSNYPNSLSGLNEVKPKD